jgi:acyl-CoA dehydrogenase
MDILAGAAISRGPRNTVANAYQAVPIGITVEGANILTRSLIIYGQGAIRCHPWVQKELRAVAEKDLAAFDEAFFGHVGFTFTNVSRALLLGLSGGRLAKAPVTGPMERHFQQLSRFSAAFVTVSDVAMGVLGSDLKRKERLSKRMADVLAWLYLGSATLKRFVDEGQRTEHEDVADWALTECEYRIQEALTGVIDNFPNRFAALKLRAWVFPLGARLSPPSDRLSARVARSLLDDGKVRRDLSEEIYVPGDGDPGLGRLEATLRKVVAARPVERKLGEAVRARRLPRLGREQLAQKGLEAGIISEDELRLLREAETARDDLIQVDAFEPEFLCRPDVVPLAEQLSS